MGTSAFHRAGERIQTGADRAIDHLGTDADDKPAEQVKALTANLKSRVGRDVSVATTVDPAILGGLVVQLGSQLIDGSIRTRLNSFATAMKG